MSEAFADEPPMDEDMAEEPEAPAFDLMGAIQSQNLAEELDDNTLNAIGSKVCEEYEIDDDSRTQAGWNARIDTAMKLALQVEEKKSYPWPNASNVKFPLISTAAIQFNARAYPAIIDGPDIVKGAVKGQNTPEKTQRADRIGKHMSWQLLEEMDDWEEDTDRLLIMLPIVGCVFRKTWFDPLKGYNCSQLVGPKDFVVNYWTKDLDTCPRGTHVLQYYPHQIAEKMRSGLWLDVELGMADNAANDDEAQHTFLEQHRLWDLDEDGYPEPYIVTVHKETQRVVRIVARFDERSITWRDEGQTEVVRIVPTRSFTKYGFIPAADGSFYDVGFGTLLGPLSETINSTLNQLMDAGHLANVQGGFIGDGVSLKSGNQTFRPGEWRKVQVTGQNLRDNIVPLPTKEPSSVLFSLLGTLIDAAKDVTATQDILGGDAGKGTMPVGTVSALIEQGLKTFTAIVKRIHRALKKELGILYRLNGRYLNPEVYFTFQDQEGVVAQEDYATDDIDIVPVSDPNMATDMQRMAQAQFIMQYASVPGADTRAMALRGLAAARVPDPEELFPKPEGPPPPDPKVIAEQGKLEIAGKKLEIEAATAVVDIARTEAETAKLKLETMMAGPEMAMLVEQAVRSGIQQALAMVENGGNPQVRPQDVPGMEGPSPDQGVLPVPGGPQGGVDGGMGQGPADVAGPAGAEPPVPGASEPGMA